MNGPHIMKPAEVRTALEDRRKIVLESTIHNHLVQRFGELEKTIGNLEYNEPIARWDVSYNGGMTVKEFRVMLDILKTWGWDETILEIFVPARGDGFTIHLALTGF